MEQLPFWLRLTEHPAYDEYWQDQAVDQHPRPKAAHRPHPLVGSEWDQEDIYGAPAAFDAVKGKRQRQCAPRARPLAPRRSQWRGLDARTARLGLGHRQMVPAERAPALPQPASEGRPAREHRPRHRVRGRAQPVAAPRRLAAGLRPRLPGEPHPALPRARQEPQLHRPPRPAPPIPTSPIPPSPVTYRARPNLSPWATGSTWRFWLEDDQRFAEARPDVLTYETEPLTQPLSLKGTPLVHLVASTSGTDSDWVVKLIDVYPAHYPQKPEMGGYELAIAMDVMRGRYRADPAHPSAAHAQPAADLRIRASERRLHGPARPPPDGPGPVELVPLVRPQPADLRPQHLLRESRGLSRCDAEGVHRRDGTWIGLPS